MPAGSWRAAIARGTTVVVLAGCVPARRPAPDPRDADQIVLYRDRALIIQRVALDAPRQGPVTLALRLPAGVDPSAVMVVDHDGLPAAALRLPERAAASGESPPDPAPDETGPLPGADADAAGSTDRPSLHGARAADPRPTDPRPTDPRPTDPRPTDPRPIELAADAPRPGRFILTLAYATDRLTWDAAYTVTLGAAHDRATVAGALAIHNATGLALRGAVRVVDAELGAWRDLAPAQLRAALAGRPPTVRDAAMHALGEREIAAGELRVALLTDAPRALRQVLVYDPIGTELDHASAVPVFDPSLGAQARSPSAVRESVELAREPTGLPAGPVQLFEDRGGSLTVLGHARLFDPASGLAAADTLAVGAARGVVARRERRDWGHDDDHHRFSEEFLIAIDNARPQPVEVIVREHLYRGQNWTLAYQSVPAVKEGPQQIALRVTVPAKGRAKVLYVVVYTW